jgi:hypothetical protein
MMPHVFTEIVFPEASVLQIIFHEAVAVLPAWIVPSETVFGLLCSVIP